MQQTETMFRETAITVQDEALVVLREQRYDVLNDLSLVSSYIQLGKPHDALRCLELAAANLLERYNPCVLPKEAWLTIIQSKQEQARKRRIALEVDIQATPPDDFNELRLLPTLMANLLDNALDAVGDVENPTVILCWRSEPGGRTLRIKNNGPPIPQEDWERIFIPGYTSKNCEYSGWGLPICKKIASELGGTLKVESDDESTSFELNLPG